MNVDSAIKSARAAIVIRAGNFLDVAAGRSLSNQLIGVRGTKIEGVGADLTAPDGATIVDFSGMTVLPGLVDCHTDLADLGEREPLKICGRSGGL